ncbi:signal peptidase I [Bacillus sp. M6-12]|uniref:signal peptidase I n=1 Tax=Bacillus sp. M6-12 TaxID=2054166 RepID=UPI000C78DCE0|nr:signal peptidase I [Bacillus sp. M6-12]PLS19705.1 signal peptidase I [Bacillus sp. M6-12]
MWSMKELFDENFKKKFVAKFGKNLWRLTRIIVILMCMSHFFHFAIVPSESMYPTMHVKDYLMVYTQIDEYERGDIIAFKFPENEEETYLKRVIGLPGDTVEVKDGLVYVNDNSLQEDYLNEKPTYTYSKTVVPEGNYFVLGDNRNNSYDSHNWGFVKKEKIRGKAVVRLLPFSRFHVINEQD